MKHGTLTHSTNESVKLVGNLLDETSERLLFRIDGTKVNNMFLVSEGFRFESDPIKLPTEPGLYILSNEKNLAKARVFRLDDDWSVVDNPHFAVNGVLRVIAESGYPLVKLVRVED